MLLFAPLDALLDLDLAPLIASAMILGLLMMLSMVVLELRYWYREVQTDLFEDDEPERRPPHPTPIATSKATSPKQPMVSALAPPPQSTNAILVGPSYGRRKAERLSGTLRASPRRSLGQVATSTEVVPHVLCPEA